MQLLPSMLADPISAFGGGLTAPPGFIFIVDKNGAFIIDSDGKYLVEKI